MNFIDFLMLPARERREALGQIVDGLFQDRQELVDYVPTRSTNILYDRSSEPVSVQAMRDYGGYLPLIGDVEGIIGIGSELSKDEPNYPVAAALGAATLLPVGDKVVREGIQAASAARNTVRERNLPATTYFTHEAVPYAGIGTQVSERNVGSSAAPHLPAIQHMTDEELLDFTMSRSFADPETGTDRLLAEVVDQENLRPTLLGRGVYDGPKGLEENPVAVARAVNVDPSVAQATESVRGLLDAQGATPFTSLKGDDMPVIFVPHADNAGTKEAMDELKAAGKQYGVTDVMDVGDGYILTNFSGGAVDTSTKARRDIGKKTGTDPISTTAGGGYPSYEGALERGLVATVDRLGENLADASPEAVEVLRGSDVVKQLARERFQSLFKNRDALGGVNRDIINTAQTVGRGGLPALESLAERFKAQAIPLQIPNLRGGAATPATHFSHARRDVLEPSQQFTSPTRGAEQALPVPYPAQTYFGVDVGKQGGYVPESTVGDVRHEADLENLLDISNGFPDDITAEADAIIANLEEFRGQPMAASERLNTRLAYQMQIAKQRGYHGLYNPEHELGSIATSFFPVTPR